MTMKDKAGFRKNISLLCGAAAYALLYAFCSQIDEMGMTLPAQALRRFAFAFPIAWALLFMLFRYVMPRTNFERRMEQKRIGIGYIWALLFCAYIPMFLIQFPGAYTYDTLPQAIQAAHGKYSTFHPIIHTLFLRFCVKLHWLTGSLERSAALCSVIQMVVVSGCFAGICQSISRSVSRRAALGAVLFFALYPAHMAFASTYAKDVMFSSFFTLFLTLCAEWTALGSLSSVNKAVCVISGVLCCMLRNNMIYAMAVWAAGLLGTRVILKRPCRLMSCALLVVGIALTSHAALNALVDADKGSIGEMLSVPAQQMARVRLLEPEKLTDEECAQMDELLVGVDYEKYDPTIADPIKDRLSSRVFKKDPMTYVKLWYNIGRKCPRVYLDAFLNLALPSLYPYSEYKVSAAYIEAADFGIGLTRPYAQPQIVQPRRFAGVRKWLIENLFATGADDNIVLRWLFNTGFIFWVLLLHVLYEVYRGGWNRVLWMMLPVLLWGTYLLGPVMQGRYLYPFICVLPLFALRTQEKDGRN